MSILNTITGTSEVRFRNEDEEEDGIGGSSRRGSHRAIIFRNSCVSFLAFLQFFLSLSLLILFPIGWSSYPSRVLIFFLFFPTSTIVLDFLSVTRECRIISVLFLFYLDKEKEPHDVSVSSIPFLFQPFILPIILSFSLFLPYTFLAVAETPPFRFHRSKNKR